MIQLPLSAGPRVSETSRRRRRSWSMRRAGKLIQATKAGEYAAHWSAIVGDALSAYPDRLRRWYRRENEAEIHRILAVKRARCAEDGEAISDAGY